MKKWILSLVCLFFAMPALAEQIRGIYINESTMEGGGNIPSLIQRAKETGINTFVIDYVSPSALYRKNLELIRHSGIHYVARIVVFPDGGTRDRVRSLDYREKKYALVKGAVDLGADAVQLDYIRYNTSLGLSNQNVTDINGVISWFKDRLRADRNTPLEVDVFGITSFGPEKHIGQDVRQIAQYVDTLCPMNYPSHFQPFSVHSAKPWWTVYHALTAMKEQFNNHVPVNIVAWIETSNYHYILTGRARQQYIAAQIRAVNDAGVRGWYAWSPKNQYDNLFQVLRSGQDKTVPQN